jgi:signal peptidase I
MKDQHPPKADPEAPELAVREHHEPEGSIRETFESIVIAFVLAFIFRAFVVEAFVIPTGSMAPTLLGQHMTITCPQCGYEFVVGPRDYGMASDGTPVAAPTQGVLLDQQGRQVKGPIEVDCPMCDFGIERRVVRPDAGDRILVLKYLYAFVEPRRWDVVVFKNPKEPDVNYIKRLVGLPGEQLWIANGNIYTRRLSPRGEPDESQPWRIQRKADRPEVQRAVWQPVYHSDYYPLDEGEPGKSSDRRQSWDIPWRPPAPAERDWTLERGARWRWRGPSTAGAAATGVLSFHFMENHHYAYHYHPYNLMEDAGYEGNGRGTVDEMRIGATVMAQEPGLTLAMITSSHDLLIRARITADGQAILETAPRQGSVDADPTWSARATVQHQPLRSGHGSAIELWHVDQSVSLWRDGEVVARWDYSLEDVGLGLEDIVNRPTPGRLPVARIEVAGAPALLRALKLDRDLYYTQSGQLGTYDSPATILPDHFFCLGDNSPRSEDSRRWTMVDPWVSRVRDVPPGFVPREMMIGRAFFVYYPASHQLGRSPIGIPNFGDMRFID